MAAVPKVWVCSRLLAGIAGSNPAGRHGCRLVSVVYCQVAVPPSHRSLIQRNPTVCVCVCVSFSLIRYNNNPLHLQ